MIYKIFNWGYDFLQKEIPILNQVLWGENMAIDTYDTYINSLKDESLRNKLQQFQLDHKDHAMKISAHIQNIGGSPKEDLGYLGLMTKTMGKINTLFHQEPRDILTELYNGEDKGLAKALEISEGQLSEKSIRVLEEIFSDEHDHLKELKKLIEQYEN